MTAARGAAKRERKTREGQEEKQIHKQIIKASQCTVCNSLKVKFYPLEVFKWSDFDIYIFYINKAL